MGGGHLAHRGEAFPGTQLAGGHQPPHLLGDLPVDRFRQGRIDVQPACIHVY